MADNINLIPASELPITEAEEVEVLCIDGGELKRKAAANLGGGGGGYVIHVPLSDLETVAGPDDAGMMQLTLTESYDNFAEILYSGGSVSVDWTNFLVANGFTGYAAGGAVTSWSYAPIAESLNLVYLATTMVVAVESGVQIMAFNIMCHNGTWTPPANT